jgi:hypothetical protein
MPLSSTELASRDQIKPEAALPNHLQRECAIVKCVFLLACMLSAALPPVVALADPAQGKPANAFPSPTRLGGDILPAERDASVNWQMAGMLSAGGIPSRTKVCATLRPLGGETDDTANIQKAIEACPLGQVVSLSAGAFTVGEGHYVLLNRGITLRGEGPGATTLQRKDGCKPLSPTSTGACGASPTPMIIVGPERYNNDTTSTNLAADIAAGSNSVTVASSSGFSVGQIVLLDELSASQWMPDVGASDQIWASPDYRVTYQMHWPVSPTDDPGNCTSAGCGGDNTAFTWFSRYDRPTAEHHRISAINGNTITFDSPATISYRTSHTAQLSHYQMPHTMNAGVENMTLSGADDGQLRFDWAAQAWAYRVECTNWSGECIAIDFSFRIQLEQFYIHDGAWCEPGGAGYNISLSHGSSETLIENGISVRCNKVMVSRSAGAGSVTAYNYMDDGYICCNSANPSSGADTWQEIGLNNSHMVGAHHMLFEGNLGFNMDSDTTHGNTIYSTYFRNWATGYRSRFTNPFDGATIDDVNHLPNPPGRNGPLRAAATHIYTYWHSFIGNVLGTPDHMSGWIFHGVDFTNRAAVFLLGYTDNQRYPARTHDPKADFTFSTPPGTTIAHGNYDYLNNIVNWAPDNGSHTLPKSLYLTQEPAFFSAGKGYTWPWVNPTGSPQLYTLPAKARYDAGTPFTQP